MKSTVARLLPPAARAAAEARESLDVAVLEVSSRIAANGGERRRLFSRLDELRACSASLRRRRARVLPLDLSRPVTFFSIEEADAASQPEPLQAA